MDKNVDSTFTNEYGYSFEVNDNAVTEIQEQILTDLDGNEIGFRTIIDSFDATKSEKKVVTSGEIEDSQGKYQFKDEQFGLGDKHTQRYVIKKYNKILNLNEEYVYTKDQYGNEFCTITGAQELRLTKTRKGTKLEEYENGQILNIYEYDSNGNAVMGIEGMDKIDDDYIINYFQSVMPLFDAENKKIKHSRGK